MEECQAVQEVDLVVLRLQEMEIGRVVGHRAALVDMVEELQRGVLPHPPELRLGQEVLLLLRRELQCGDRTHLEWVVVALLCTGTDSVQHTVELEEYEPLHYPLEYNG